MRFEWDEAKSQSNQRKHRISFEAARRVFADPLQRSWIDSVVDHEERWKTLGSPDDGVSVLVVIHTYRRSGRDEVVRIISARKATRHERREYEEG